MRLFTKVCVFQIHWMANGSVFASAPSSPVSLRVLHPCVGIWMGAAAVAAVLTRERAWIKAEGRAAREPEKNNLQLKANSFKVMNPPG